jgi:hypothetical protein
VALDRDQGLDRGASRTPGREIRHLAVVEAAPDQQALGPEAVVVCGAEFGRLKIGQFKICPVIQPRPLGAVSRREAPPGRWLEPVRNVCGRATNNRLAILRMERVV